MATTIKNNEFQRYMTTIRHDFPLDAAIAWLRLNMKPEEVFPNVADVSGSKLQSAYARGFNDGCEAVLND